VRACLWGTLCWWHRLAALYAVGTGETSPVSNAGELRVLEEAALFVS